MIPEQPCRPRQAPQVLRGCTAAPGSLLGYRALHKSHGVGPASEMLCCLTAPSVHCVFHTKHAQKFRLFRLPAAFLLPVPWLHDFQFNLKRHQATFWVVAVSVPSTVTTPALLAPQADSARVVSGHVLSKCPCAGVTPGHCCCSELGGVCPAPRETEGKLHLRRSLAR